MLEGDSIAAVQGLNVYTVRDRRTAVCYTLFVLGPVNGAWSNNSVPQPALTSEELGKIHVAQTLKEAARLRDQKIAALRSRPSAGWPGQNEAEEERIQDEYASVVRSVLPDVYPPGRLAPAWRSTTPDELDDAVRRAIADGDAVIAAMTRRHRMARFSNCSIRFRSLRDWRLQARWPAPRPPAPRSNSRLPSEALDQSLIASLSPFGILHSSFAMRAPKREGHGGQTGVRDLRAT